MPCYGEMLILLSCFKARIVIAKRTVSIPQRNPDACHACVCAPQKGNFEDVKCQTEIKALNECMALQAKKPKEMNTVNHHLQRLSNAAKRG
jgi:hypothetical protein